MVITKASKKSPLGIKSYQSVTATGEEVYQKLISGVHLRYATPHLDERGTLTEIYDPRWGLVLEPMVYAYHVTIRPGQVKGWSVHEHQIDRNYFYAGVVKIALYDARQDSSTYQMINEFCVGAERPALIIIPSFVYHAVYNVGIADAAFVSLPTKPYDHARPDRYRIRMGDPQIPYDIRSENIGH